jgi:anthranilate synthase component II
MRVFLLDNYDSFTYNLVQLLGRIGADVTVARNDAVTVEAVEALEPDAIVISPGPSRPENADHLGTVRDTDGLVAQADTQHRDR